MAQGKSGPDHIFPQMTAKSHLPINNTNPTYMHSLQMVTFNHKRPLKNISPISYHWLKFLDPHLYRSPKAITVKITSSLRALL